MTQRLDYQAAAPHVMRALYEGAKALSRSGLEPALQLFVQLRVSQINRCAFCIALHTREAEALGERGDRLSGLPAWREAPWYSERERAALEWAEALSGIAQHHPDPALFERAKAHFNEAELAELTLAITAITSWNMFNVAFGTPPDRADEVFRQLHSATAAAN